MRCANAALKLVLVGDGPLHDELRARCPQAVFAGQRSGADLAAHYASADLFVFPSLTETFGNVTPEAMASGLPVLAFDYAAASQLIRHGENGRLAPFGDRGEFLVQALALVRDPGAARTLGQAARLSAMELSWDQIVRRIETVFLAAMIGQRTPRPVSSLVAEWDLRY